MKQEYTTVAPATLTVTASDSTRKQFHFSVIVEKLAISTSYSARYMNDYANQGHVTMPTGPVTNEVYATVSVENDQIKTLYAILGCYYEAKLEYLSVTIIGRLKSSGHMDSDGKKSTVCLCIDADYVHELPPATHVEPYDPFDL